MKSLKIGLLNYRLNADNDWLEYKVGPFNAPSRIALREITSVTVTTINLGKSRVSIIGGGTTLATLDMPRQWAFKVQAFITDAIR